jgi:hypothetical protein
VRSPLAVIVPETEAELLPRPNRMRVCAIVSDAAIMAIIAKTKIFVMDFFNIYLLSP